MERFLVAGPFEVDVDQAGRVSARDDVLDVSGAFGAQLRGGLTQQQPVAVAGPVSQLEPHDGRPVGQLRGVYQAQFSRSCPQPQGRRGWLHGESVDDLVVAVLGVGEGDPGVHLEGLAAGVAGVGLDEGVVDPLGLSQVKRKWRSR